MGTTQTSLRIPSEIAERYSRLADTTGRTKAFYVNKALEGSIDLLEHEFGILHDVEEWRAGRLETVTLEEMADELGLAR